MSNTEEITLLKSELGEALSSIDRLMERVSGLEDQLDGVRRRADNAVANHDKLAKSVRDIELIATSELVNDDLPFIDFGRPIPPEEE